MTYSAQIEGGGDGRKTKQADEERMEHCSGRRQGIKCIRSVKSGVVFVATKKSLGTVIGQKAIPGNEGISPQTWVNARGGPQQQGSEAAATMTTNNEGDMLRSQNNTKEQIEENTDEIKALIEKRRNIWKEDKEQMKNVSKKIKKKCIRRQKRGKKTRKDSANTGTI